MCIKSDHFGKLLPSCSSSHAACACGQHSVDAMCAQEFEYLHLDYDPVINGEYWSRRPVLVIKRALQVLC